jgi:hypothetical protein
MSEQTTAPDEVVLDGLLVTDLCWLVSSLEEFARFGDVSAVTELLGFANPRLSPDGLARIAGEFGMRLRRGLEAAR